MCPHCLNRIAGGCVHCRPDRLEIARRDRQGRHRLTDDQRREFGLVVGPLYTPPGKSAPQIRVAATRNPDRKLVALRKEFGATVLPTDFTL